MSAFEVARAGVAALAGALAIAGCADVLDIRTTRVLVTDTPVDGRCEGMLRVRVLYDASGSTKDVGVAAGKGVLDYLRAVDAAGGIRGCRLDIAEGDTRYDVEATLAVYRDWASKPEWPEVTTVFGQGTPMTLALGPLVAQEKKLLVTTAFSGEIAAAAPIEHDIGVPSLSGSFGEATLPVRKKSPGYPYVFFQGTDYTTSARIAMNFIWKRGAKRVGFFACSTSAFCTDPVDGAKTFLALLGTTKVGRDLAIELDEDEASIEQKIDSYFGEEQAKASSDPSYVPVDWIWFGNTRTSLANVGRALAKVSAKRSIAPKVITNNWGLDELLYTECGDACVGIHGLQPYPAFGDGSAAGMANLLEVHRARRIAEGEPPTAHATVQYVYGFVAGAAWRAAVEAALDAGVKPTGESLRAELERFQLRAMEGLATISYMPTDHRPQSSARVYVLGQTGRLEPVGQPISIALQSDWLGW